MMKNKQVSSISPRKFKHLLILFTVLVLSFSLPSFASAQEQNPNNLDFGLVCLIAISDGLVSPGPGAAVSWNNPTMFGPVGLGGYLNIVVPFVTPFDETYWGLAISLLAGPSYMIYDNGVFAIPVTAGVHYNVVGRFGENGAFGMNIGAGASFDFLWRFAQKWHAYGRVMAVYNFAAGGEFLMFPGLGLGFSF